MIGLIFKIALFFAVLMFGVLLLLNITNAWNPGTLSITPPDKAPCERYAKTNFPDKEIQLMQVRWVVTAENYGWGCVYEFGDFDVRSVTPMPE